MRGKRMREIENESQKNGIEREREKDIGSERERKRQIARVR